MSPKSNVARNSEEKLKEKGSSSRQRDAIMKYVPAKVKTIRPLLEVGGWENKIKGVNE
jgi:hypothetical protein